MKARSAKRKGTRLEQEVVKAFLDAGIPARRQPGSGIYADFPHDVEITPGDKRYIVECKARKSGFATLDRWRGHADLLVIKPDRKEPLVYMPISVLASLVGSENE